MRESDKKRSIKKTESRGWDMDTIEIGLASSIFSADAVVRTMHRYSADFFTEVDSVEKIDLLFI